MLEKITRALQSPARAAIRAAETDALRIVDGYGDGLDDIAIDDFAGRWLVETKGELPSWLLGEERNLEIRNSGEAEGRGRQSGRGESSFPDFLISRFNSAALPVPLSIYWKRLGDKESPRWIAGERLEQPFEVRENGLKYWIDFASGYSQGIFPDQRDNRLALRNMALGKTVLNTFAYTCAFGVGAAAGGGETVNLDLSKRYLEWGKRNYTLNGIDPVQPRHDFIYGDVADWLRRFRKKGRKFDIILLDPPTFSRNDKGVIFRIEDSFTPLVQEAVALLNPGGTLFCSTNQRSMSAPEFRRSITDGMEDLENWELRLAPMPGDFSGEDYLKTVWAARAG